MPKKPEPLKPLIPLDELKTVVAGLITVPKDAIKKAEAERLKMRRGTSKKNSSR